MRILEPSLGDGSFVFALLEVLQKKHSQSELISWINENLYGVEFDARMMERFVKKWQAHGLGEVPKNIELGDFFRWLPPQCDRKVLFHPRSYFASPLEYFDLIIGNPPFGGSFDPQIQDKLDAMYGTRNGMKIKKETYSFFLLKCLDFLKSGGQLCFICSDTLLTISTMRGLRHHLQENCDVNIEAIPGEFEETAQNMVLIKLRKKNKKSSHIKIFGDKIKTETIKTTPNLSWRINNDYARYFSGHTLGDQFVATSGMTIGNNKLFLRKIINGWIEEPYQFSYAQEPITLAGEIERARLGRISAVRQETIRDREKRGDTRRIIRWELRKPPLRLSMPHNHYRFYSKATPAILYADPQWAIFWKEEGNYVYTFKKSGNWYLHGVGGKNYFGREGMTWNLIASRMRTRWLPPGYILDSGAPCAFPRPGVSQDELFFVMGWTLTDLCTEILKNVINHTRNIQGKDFERLPYPVWVGPESKAGAIGLVKSLIQDSRTGLTLNHDHPRVKKLDKFYAYQTKIHAPKKALQFPKNAVQTALNF